jgi:phosphoribosylformylglycinamidine (FGAM) synthase-like enzyme
VSDGGLAVALSEMLMGAQDDRVLGADVDLEAFEVDPAVVLFSERPAIVYEVPFERWPGCRSRRATVASSPGRSARSPHFPRFACASPAAPR